jgi:N-acetyl-gamma-glutamyl-phosphate reductase
LYLQPASKDVSGLNDAVAACYRDAYANEPFVRIVEGKALPDTKNVVGTNFLELGWRVDPRTKRLIVMSAEDNIVKGTSGQAIQCFNILSGIPETTGLY